MGRKCFAKKAGFTLVELLVTMAILGIIVVPILTAFISAAKANSKSKLKLEATTAAQNVMENLKAKGVKAFTESIGASPDAEGIYLLGGENEASVPEQIVNGESFRFIISIDPTPYGTDSSNTGYNGMSIANIDRMDVLQDAFYVQDLSTDSKAVTDFMADSNVADDYTEEQVKAKLTRTIDVVISGVGSGQSNVTKVRIDRTYGIEGSTVDPLVYSSTIYDNSDVEGGKLRSVYVFYTPICALKDAGTTSLDKINIYNNTKDTAVGTGQSSMTANVYLIKQHYSTEAEENLKENGYKAEVSVVEVNSSNPAAWMPPEGYRAFTSLYTNIGYSLNENASGKYTAIPSQLSKIIYKCGSYTSTEASTAKTEGYLGMSTIDASSTSNRLYAVTLNVYRGNDSNPIYVMNGTAEA